MRVHRRGKTRRAPLSAALREFFLSGDYELARRAARAAGEADGHGFRGLRDLFLVPETTRAERWREVGAELTAEWIAEHPGSRPAGWWQYEAPGARQVLTGTIEAPTVIESEAAYLQRHDLLTAAERRVLKPAAYEPERIPEENEDTIEEEE